tara:strand:+ start:3279 stop:3809 length:531 start_codon:yes stop_codon:yes gene_type:complete
MSEDDFLKQLALATIADNRARQAGSNVDFGIDDFPPIPEFLRRPWTKKEKERHKAQVELDKDRTANPGKYIKMPPMRVDPRRVEQAATRRAMPTKGKKDKKAKLIHPSTEAIKDATRHLKNGEKRKALYSIARENGLDPLKWDHLNVGQVSMNLSNVLRSRYYKMQEIKVDGVKVP